MKTNPVSKILSFILALNLFIIILFLALVPPAMNNSFYYEQFATNNSYQKANTSPIELKRLIDHTLDYTYGLKPEFQYQITLNDGRVIDAFSEREILHMEDVQNLFIGGRLLTLFSLLSLVLITSYFLINYKKFDKANFKVMANTIIGILAFTLVVLGFAAIDFTRAFTIFHEIFFSNDLWILYSTDYLIIMLPEILFFRLALQIIVGLVVYLTALLILLFRLASNKSRKVIKA
jgi:integral membrane protein (TIGR01906 family)